MVLPFVMAAVLFLLLSSVKFAPSLSPAEKELAAFTCGTVPVVSKRQPVIAAGLESPITIPAAAPVVQRKEFPREPLSRMAPPPAQLPATVVTLILVNNGKKMAVINGVVVKEGDIVDSSKVVKIEKNRVLLSDKKGSKWLKME